jgi:hypothetical protein
MVSSSLPPRPPLSIENRLICPKLPSSSFLAAHRLTEAVNPLMMEKLAHGDRRPAAVAANAAA